MRKFLIVFTILVTAGLPCGVAAQHQTLVPTYQIGLRPLPPAQAKLARIINVGAQALNGAILFNMMSGYLGVVSWLGWSAGLIAGSAAGGVAGHVFYTEPTY